MLEGPVARREDVPEAFDDVAERYDLMVGLSPGYHRQLRSSAHALVRAVASPPAHVLDLGCGSGASTAALVQALTVHHGPEPTTAVLAMDGSAGMLESARRKSWPATVSFAHGRAEALAGHPELETARAAGGLDGVLAAYLVRNVPDRDATLSAIHDELRPGGTLVVHEYSVRGRLVPSLLWTLVCWGVIIPLGWVTSRNTSLYRYLWRSVLHMDSTADLEERLRRAGFERVATHPVPGWQRGTVHTVVGHKPLAPASTPTSAGMP
ncbi:class I SAM-dependent methyltransferase [Terrabacter sp. NPDC080008]|uniref:class I SAM-dependent methyltransferase n=1 Tax=Terrabacter sp. NPDC080008 TaxID=3155176 RepID=UPI00344C5121